MLRIKQLSINGIGGIDNLSLVFEDQFNIICGPNGIGKTTILDCIGQSFSYHNSNTIKRNAKHDSGSWSLKVDVDGLELETNNKKKGFHPTDEMDSMNQLLVQYSINILTLKTNRHFEYKQLHSVARDQKQDENAASVYGINANDLKNWFVNRFMWSTHEKALTATQLSNLKTAMHIFGLLDDQINFARVKIETFDILVKNKQGSELYFEYLSSGYKSVIFILIGIMKEIEIRFTDEKQIAAKDFNGVILIDELDLHLHPQWQSKLVEVLKIVFPVAQFIVTTHSPHMIQVADPKEIIPLGFNSDGSVSVRVIPSSEFGYQGWTVEEILTDVMGLNNTISEPFRNTLSRFEEALTDENKEQAEEAYKILSKMLHPENHLRKILKIQMASLGE
ncbi:AAA family ATPase [Cohnella lupini]|uniref:Putative ATP-binding protein involved in virulence n=1 Tax=Cohnella lupini TaxID=1294267 RepID=A0A3D9HZ62_9BACL|nr:AAA family ATPase [Cohnella lupini]RED54812.1 putative ATP-binding protein involved in virulence [Cohnella lupini]